jgi:hypothetical protein
VSPTIADLTSLEPVMTYPTCPALSSGIFRGSGVIMPDELEDRGGDGRRLDAKRNDDAQLCARAQTQTQTRTR